MERMQFNLQLLLLLYFLLSWWCACVCVRRKATHLVTVNCLLLYSLFFVFISNFFLTAAAGVAHRKLGQVLFTYIPPKFSLSLKVNNLELLYISFFFLHLPHLTRCCTPHRPYAISRGINNRPLILCGLSQVAAIDSFRQKANYLYKKKQRFLLCRKVCFYCFYFYIAHSNADQ